MSAGSDPVVSVLMPVYNGERFLESAVRSVLSQSFEPFELVIVDDGSTDGSPAVLARLATDDRRVRIHTQENRGHAGALNTALELARGEFVAVLDCDDEALPARLGLQLDALSRSPELGAVGGGVAYVDDAGRVFDERRFLTEPHAVKRALATTVPILHSAMTARRQALVAVGGYRPTLSLALDYDLLLRLGERYALANVPETVVRYRVHGGQTTVNQVERISLTAIVALRSAAARAAGLPDPVPVEDASVGELADVLGVTRVELDIRVARDCVWYGKLAARAGRRRAASKLFEIASASAARVGDEALASEVATGRSRVRLDTRRERLRAGATRPFRRLLGRA